MQPITVPEFLILSTLSLIAGILGYGFGGVRPEFTAKASEFIHEGFQYTLNLVLGKNQGVYLFLAIVVTGLYLITGEEILTSGAGEPGVVFLVYSLGVYRSLWKSVMKQRHVRNTLTLHVKILAHPFLYILLKTICLAVFVMLGLEWASVILVPYYLYVTFKLRSPFLE